jgi:hypothetical protein
MRSCCECFTADMYLQAVFVDRLCRVALYCHGRVPGKVYSARSRLDMRSWLSALGSVFRDSESKSETVGTEQGERAEVGSQVTAGDCGEGDPELPWLAALAAQGICWGKITVVRQQEYIYDSPGIFTCAAPCLLALSESVR